MSASILHRRAPEMISDFCALILGEFALVLKRPMRSLRSEESTHLLKPCPAWLWHK